jgi:hypothetical protein
MPLQPETGLGLLGERGGRYHLVWKIHNEVAVPADEVGMMSGFDVIASHLVEGVDLDDQTLLAKHLQGLVHGVEGDGWHILPNFLVNLLCGGMIPAGFQI